MTINKTPIPTDRATLTIIQNYMEARRDQTLNKLEEERALAKSSLKDDIAARLNHLDALNREVFNLDLAIKYGN